MRTRRKTNRGDHVPGREPLADAVERVAGWSARHRVRALALWFGLVAAAIVAAVVVPGVAAPNTDAGEAGRAQAVLRAQGVLPPVQESVLVEAADRTGRPRLARDPAVRGALADLGTSLRGIGGHVTAVHSPLDAGAPAGSGRLTPDGRSALVTFEVTGSPVQVKDGLAAAERAVHDVATRHRGVRVAQAGDQSLSTAVDDNLRSDLLRSHLLSLPVTLLILLVVFGSLVAAGLPVLLTATVVAATFALIQVLGKVVPINSAAFAMILLVGVAVGVDYSLFHLRRYREERRAGHAVEAAVRRTARTSGRVVVVSGVTVMLCVSGLLFSGLGVFQGLAVGTVLAVGLAVVGSVTVLPAVLALAGDRVDALRLPWVGRGRVAVRESRTWERVARTVVRRPLAFGLAAAAVLVVLALPAAGMHLQDPAATESLPRRVPAVDAALRIQDRFPGAATPARVMVWDASGAPADRAAVRDAVADLRQRAARSGGLVREPITVAPVGRTLMLRVPLAGAGTDERSGAALQELRSHLLPASFGDVDDLRYAVGGRTATPYDFGTRLGDRAPWVYGFVLVLAFVLLAWSFRSLVIPLASIVLNLLSVGAAYGVVTWVFQDGHLTSVLGFAPYGGIAEFLPVVMFVLLFGLSTDYQIFVLSRIRERQRAGAAPAEAITGGLAASAGVVTSAAVIMTAVFSVFVTLTAIEYKMLGVGMAFAVLVDATLVRGVLLPAALTLLDRRARTARRARASYGSASASSAAGVGSGRASASSSVA